MERARSECARSTAAMEPTWAPFLERRQRALRAQLNEMDDDRSMRAVKGSLGQSPGESEGEGHAATPVLLFQTTIVGVVDGGERLQCFRLSEKSHWFSERNENAAGGLFQHPDVIECRPGAAATAHTSRFDQHLPE